MNKISEKELKEILNTYNNKSITVKIEGVIGAKLTINKLKYHYKSGIIYLSDEIMDTELEINIAFVYICYESENKTGLEIKLDNDQDVTVEL
ncbi:MAG: hypothetical protein FWF46_05470 [Oscillospiraceae bacterium]|nr:hypothetical protein [Oscillospiraceae bacterium]